MLGVVALGRALAGWAGAAVAIMGLALLPDAAAYGLRNGFPSFHWMLEISPGSLYGVGVALGAIALLVSWVREGDWARLALSALLLLGVFLLRANVFVWALVPSAARLWWALPWPGRRLASCYWAPALLLIGRGEIASVGLSGFLTRYLAFLHNQQAPTGYDGLYAGLTPALGPVGALPFGVLLALAAMGGPCLLLFLAGAALAARRGRLGAEDVIPFALRLWAAALSVLAPTPFHGDFSDFRQRAFVLVVVVLIAWSARFLLLPWPGGPRALPLGAAALAALLVTPLWLPSAKTGRMAWASAFSGQRPAPGLLEAGHWMRAAAGPGESFLLAGLRPDEVFHDDAMVLIGVSGVPAHVSRPSVLRACGPPRSVVAEERMALAAAVAAEPQAARARARLAAAGVGFYIAPRSAMPAWDPEGAQADWRGGDYALWRMPR